MLPYHRVMSPKDADRMANSVDPDQTDPLCADLVYTVCPDLSVWKLRTVTVSLRKHQLVYWGWVIEPRHDKTNKMSVHPAKTQISLGIRPVWSESSLCTQWVAEDPMFLHAASEDSDRTGRMPRLIWVFAGRTLTLLVLSGRSSILQVFVIQLTTNLLCLAS